MDEAAHRIGRLFDSGVKGFYSKEHLEAGFIEEKNGKVNEEVSNYGIQYGRLKVACCDVSHYLEVATAVES